MAMLGRRSSLQCSRRLLAGLNLKKDASVPLSRIKDLRFGTQGSPYRTSLQISKEVEPRWITVIYTVPQSSRLSNAVNYKLVHFIAPTVELVELWRTTLERFKEGRVAKAIAEGEELLVSPEVHAENEKRVVKEAEVHQLCARLGVGMGRTEVSAAFRVSPAFAAALGAAEAERPARSRTEDGRTARLPRLCGVPRICQAPEAA